MNATGQTDATAINVNVEGGKLVVSFNKTPNGFTNVFQLDKGILGYLAKYGQAHYEGECFVFDSRVAVDQNLKPSAKFSLCPHCGDVSSQEMDCLKCDHHFLLCTKCLESSKEDTSLKTCSKNCRHHYKLRPNTKGPHQKQYYTD